VTPKVSEHPANVAIDNDALPCERDIVRQQAARLERNGLK
jgi:hypothetical protein